MVIVLAFSLLARFFVKYPVALLGVLVAGLIYSIYRIFKDRASPHHNGEQRY